MEKIALQLYSLREDMAKDFKGIFPKVAKMGYTGVEFAGFGDIAATDMKKLLSDNDLESVSAHVPLEVVSTDKIKNIIEYSQIIGSRYLVCPYSEIKNREDTLRLAEQLNKAADLCNDEGLKFGYHNHAHEFVTDNGEYLLDILLKNTSPSVIAELDVFWVATGGADVLEYIKKWYGRVPLIHLKQLSKKADIDGASVESGGVGMEKLMELSGLNVNAGDGIIDFAELYEYGKHHGVTDFIYEQECYPTHNPLESMAESAKYLLSL